MVRRMVITKNSATWHWPMPCTKASLHKGLEVTNYGAFLNRFPPTYEVEIDEGPKGEGTSWSCAHGVGRWKEDCGCSTGGQAGWNQKWRKPLREALDFLRDELSVDL